MKTVKGETGKFVVNAGLDGEPMKSSESRSCASATRLSQYYTSSIILNALKSREFSIRETRQEGVAKVKTRQNERDSESIGRLGR